MQQAVASKNLDAVVALYATDAVLMPPNADAARGQPAVRTWWAQTTSMPNPSLTLTSSKIDIAASGDLATDVGTYAFSGTTDQGPVNDRGKYMVKFRKVGADWKIASDIFNSDLPVQAPAPVAFVVIEPAGDEMTMNAAAGMAFQPLEVPGFKSGCRSPPSMATRWARATTLSA